LYKYVSRSHAATAQKEEVEQRQREQLERAHKWRESAREAEKREETRKANLATTAPKKGGLYFDYSSDLDEDGMRARFALARHRRGLRTGG
jgi:hypothetical protein